MLRGNGGGARTPAPARNLLRLHPSIRLEILRKTTETLVKITGFRAEIQTQEFPDVKQEC
jgi:hypothetical protein